MSGGPPRNIDFNDVMLEQGSGAIREALRQAKPPPLPLPVELFEDVQPRLDSRWLVKRQLLASTKIVFFGAPGSGKSFLAIDIGFHLAAELDWFGRRTTGARVVYVAAEGQAGVRLRIEALKRTYPGQGDIPFALIPTAVDLLDPSADLAKLAAVLKYLAGRWKGVDLLVVDTLAASFGGGDENGPDMAAFVGNVDKLCAPYECASLIVTHAPLDKDAKRPRGHSSLWGSADTVWQIIGDRDAPARRIHVLKQKDCDPGPDIMFALRPVEIGIDEDGDPVTSCIVEPSEFDAAAMIGRRRMSAKEKIVYTALERAIIAKGIFPPATIPDNVCNRARTGKVVALSEWRSEALSALSTPDTKPDSARRSFDRARDALQAAGNLAVWEDWAWLG